MKGNRPKDVCALCDRAIDPSLPGEYGRMHYYVGPGWVHGGGREYIATHYGCLTAPGYPKDSPAYKIIHTYLKNHIMI
jgi:hypothetical protein